jgi:hypothetical protein
MTQATKAQTDSLEMLVDSLGLVQVVEILASLCFDKQEHLETNWQESPASLDLKAWKHNGGYLYKVASHVWRQSFERAS